MKRKCFATIMLFTLFFCMSTFVLADTFANEGRAKQIVYAESLEDDPDFWLPETTMPNATYGKPYNWAPIQADSGEYEVIYTIAPMSALPAGFLLNSSNCQITSTNVMAIVGKYYFAIRAEISVEEFVEVTFNLTVVRGDRNHAVQLVGWTFGDTANTPILVPQATENASVTFQYSTAADGVFSTAVPTNAGSYWVRAVIGQTANYNACTTASVPFVIERKPIQRPSLVQSSFPYNGATRTVQLVSQHTGFVFGGVRNGLYAGIRTATATLASANYMWSTGDSDEIINLDWSITPAAVSANLQSVYSYTYGFTTANVLASLRTAQVTFDAAAGIYSLVPGTWMLASAYPNLNAGTRTIDVQFLPEDAANFAVWDTSINLNVYRADRNNTVTLAGWTFGKTANEPSIIGAVQESAVYKFEYSTVWNGVFTETQPSAAGTYWVRAVIDETENFNTQTTLAVSFTISKADRVGHVVIENWSYGGSPSTPTISPIVEENAAVTWWYSDTEFGSITHVVPTTAGTHWIMAVIDASANFNSFTTERTSFTIFKANRTNTVSIANWVFGENASTPTVVGSVLEGAQIRFEYAASVGGTWTTTVPNQSATWFVRAVIAESTNYYGLTTAAVSFAILKANRQHIVSITGWQFDETARSPIIIGTIAEGATVNFSYSSNADSGWAANFSATAGTWFVRATIAETTNYNEQITSAVSFVISKANRFHFVTVSGWTYNESPNEPALSTAAAESPLVHFEYVGPQGDTWSTEVPTEAGVWYVRAVIGETANYNAFTTTASQFSIAKAERTHRVTLSKIEWVYGAPGVVLGINSSVQEEANIFYRFSDSNQDEAFTIQTMPTNAGQWYVRAVIAETKNYKQLVTVAVQFTILRADRSHTLSAEDWEYNQIPLIPVVQGSVGDSAQILFEYSTNALTGFTTTVPVNVGTYYVRAHIAQTANFNEYFSTSVSFVITRANRNHSVIIEGWTFGESANEPVIVGTIQEGAVNVFEYSANAVTGFTVGAPANAGTWFVRAVISGTSNYFAQTTEAVQFVIARAAPVIPTITTIYNMGNSLSSVALPAGWTWAESGSLRGGTWAYMANYQHPSDPNSFQQLFDVAIYVSTYAEPMELGSALAAMIQAIPNTVALHHADAISAAITTLNTLMAELSLGATDYAALAALFPDLDINRLLLSKEVLRAKQNSQDTLDSTYDVFASQIIGRYDSAFIGFLDIVYVSSIADINREGLDLSGIQGLESKLNSIVSNTLGSCGEIFELWQSMSALDFEFFFTPGFTVSSAQVYLPNGITWAADVDGAAILTSGTHHITATFTISGYDPMSFVVIILVNRASRSHEIDLESWIYGSPNSPSVGVVAEGGAITYYYSTTGVVGTFTITSQPSNVGTYWVRAVISATANYDAQTTDSVTFTISRTPRSHTISIKGWVFGESINEPLINGTVAESASVIYQYSRNSTSGFTATPPTASGIWFVRAVIQESQNFYGQTTAAVQFTITKAERNSAVIMSGWTYGQQANTPTINGNVAESARVYYYYSLSGEEGTFTLMVCPTTAGVFYVRAFIEETDNFFSQTTLPIQVAIARAERNHSVSITGWVYGRNANSPNISGTVAEGAEVAFYYSTTGAVGSFTITDQPVNAYTYWVRAVISQTANFNAQTTPAAIFIIEKAAPHTTVVISGSKKATFLRNIGLPEGWNWAYPDEVLRNGTDIYYANYKHPTQPNNYRQVTNLPVTITAEAIHEDLITLINGIIFAEISLEDAYIDEVYRRFHEFAELAPDNDLLVTNKDNLLLAKNVLDTKRSQKQRLNDSWLGFEDADNEFRSLLNNIYSFAVVELNKTQLGHSGIENFTTKLMLITDDLIAKGETVFDVWIYLNNTSFDRIYQPGVIANAISLPSGMHWDTETGRTLLTAGTHTLNAIYSLAGFAPITFTLDIYVEKATPVVEIPVISGLQESGRLSSLSFLLPEGWAWKEPQQFLIAGVNAYWAMFTPEDILNFSVVYEQITLETEYAASSLITLIDALETNCITLESYYQIYALYEKLQIYKEMLEIQGDDDPLIYAEVPNIEKLLKAKKLYDEKVHYYSLLVRIFENFIIPAGSNYIQFKEAIDMLRESAIAQIDSLQRTSEIDDAVKDSSLYAAAIFNAWEQLITTNFNRTYSLNLTGESLVFPSGVVLNSLFRNESLVVLLDVLNAGSYKAMVTFSQTGYNKTINFEILFSIAKANISIYNIGGAPVIEGVHSGALSGLSTQLPARWLFENGDEIITPGINKYWIVYIPADSDNYNSIRIQIEIEGEVESNALSVVLIIFGCITVTAAIVVQVVWMFKKRRKQIV